eukprot:scaffold3641_cov32-Tisochrysis_lutea.AAC.5
MALIRVPNGKEPLCALLQIWGGQRVCHVLLCARNRKLLAKASTANIEYRDKKATTYTPITKSFSVHGAQCAVATENDVHTLGKGRGHGDCRDSQRVEQRAQRVEGGWAPAGAPPVPTRGDAKRTIQKPSGGEEIPRDSYWWELRSRGAPPPKKAPVYFLFESFVNGSPALIW